MYTLNIAQRYEGKKFGLLTIIKYIPGSTVLGKYGMAKVLCKCDCGSNAEFLHSSVVYKNVVSCGCLNPHPKWNGGSKKYEKEYNTWSKMRARCTSKKCKDYKYYGERGIKICTEWINSFNEFIKDMGEKPHPKELYSLERLNNDGNYEPSNCIWASRKQQSQNRRYKAYTQECQHCQKTYKKSKSTKSKFCSQKCYSEHRKTSIARNCLYCHNIFIARCKSDPKKFCSPKCGALNRAINVRAHP